MSQHHIRAYRHLLLLKEVSIKEKITNCNFSDQRIFIISNNLLEVYDYELNLRKATEFSSHVVNVFIFKS